VKHGTDPIGDAASRLGLDLSREAAAKLDRFERLLVERAVPLGLVARADRGRIRERHVLDCLRAAAAVEPSDRSAIDIGSGAGLPGIVVAVVCPQLRVLLVEPRRPRVAFLELAVETLGATNASVIDARIDEVAEPADLCFARAFAPLPDAWALASPHLRPGGRLVYFAGAGTAPAPEIGIPGARSVRTLPNPLLESGGPLIIMTA
jgi:16S rRNA (guanine527-N7)-methyltransferase